MELYVMVRRKKVSYFIDAKESTSILELKKILCGITNKSTEDMRLYKGDVCLQPCDDSKHLSDLGFQSSGPFCPHVIGLTFRLDAKSPFEPLDITPLSDPPDLPEVMKPVDSSSMME